MKTFLSALICTLALVLLFSATPAMALDTIDLQLRQFGEAEYISSSENADILHLQMRHMKYGADGRLDIIILKTGKAVNESSVCSLAANDNLTDGKATPFPPQSLLERMSEPDNATTQYAQVFVLDCPTTPASKDLSTPATTFVIQPQGVQSLKVVGFSYALATENLPQRLLYTLTFELENGAEFTAYLLTQ